jgi:hypothetical protein
MRNKNLILFIFLLLTHSAFSQEFNARVSVVANRVSNNVNRNTFQTLQVALNNFINNRKWTNDTYAANERIDCTFLLNLESTDELNVYNASLTIQAARPVFNTNYLSPLINYKDDNFTFKYLEFQQLDFNDNRVTGNDPLVSNLTAVFAYYAYMILGFDGASFSMHGGDNYFQKAQNVVNNAPDGRNVIGWKAFDGIRNRYWLVNNILDTRYGAMHDVYYNYYRLGLDILYQDENAARAEILNTLNVIDQFNIENPNTMINQFFFQGKSNELIKIFSKATPPDRANVVDILSRLDVTNASKYQDQLK